MKPFAEYVGKDLWVHINGKTFKYESQASQRRKRGGSGSLEKDIQAPMPGKITSVLVSIGDKVKRDQPLVVMEAMKMEYTLQSGAESVVTEIRCAVGDQVKAGEILICLQ